MTRIIIFFIILSVICIILFNNFNPFYMEPLFFHILKLSVSPKYECGLFERLSGIIAGFLGMILIDPLVWLWDKFCDKSYDL